MKKYNFTILRVNSKSKNEEYDKKVKIIYITNYTDYKSSAFSVHAFVYLVKPIKEKDLHKQLEEALSYMKEDEECIVEFITEEGIVRIDIKKIHCFEYVSRKILMKTSEKAYILIEI